MDYQQLAERLFPQIQLTPDDIEARYPARQLPEGAKVTRIAPSPTGFMHMGNLYGAIVDERLAHQSGGVFYLRIEDTDQKRLVEGGIDTILSVFHRFGLQFDEGATKEGDHGVYGPYQQSKRGEIYQTYVKALVAQGKAYPCFCTEEELNAMRSEQEARKEITGYYGSYARCRTLSMEEVEKRLDAGEPYVIRFRSEGSTERKVPFTDLIKGKLELTENDQDIVILKRDGLPTYHMAHVIDDYLMGTTHVVRGEEWLPTLPIHLQLFDALGFKRPKYAHTAQLMKMDGTSKRKLSKRKDPEFALDYYFETGVPIAGIIEYMMTLLNSNFEEWRLANPMADLDAFRFTTAKMSGSGSLFDLDKMHDVCKNVISRMSADEVYEQVGAWAAQYDPDFAAIWTANPTYAKQILSIGRGGKKPRKDITLWSDVKSYVSFFYDELFTPDFTQMPSAIPQETVRQILTDYSQQYRPEDDSSAWFERIKAMCPAYGFASEMKQYRQNPQDYAGHVGDLSMVLRVAVCGRSQAPDLYTVMQLLGQDTVRERLARAAQTISA